VAFSKYDVDEALCEWGFPSSVEDVINRVDGSGADKQTEIVDAVRGLEEPAGASSIWKI
jgi:hypothetical protein